jgi:UDP-N-acetylmuramate-alanine ligase
MERVICTNDGGATAGANREISWARVFIIAVRIPIMAQPARMVNYAATHLLPITLGLTQAVYVAPARNEIHSTINLRVPGRHNVQNAPAAFAVAT